MEAALAPVLEEEVLSQVLELLRLLRALRCRGGDVIAAWEALPLECLLMLMAASSRAQSALQDGSRNGMLVCRFSLSLVYRAPYLENPLLRAPALRRRWRPAWAVIE